MNRELLTKIQEEEVRGRQKWGHIDQKPQDYMIAIQEEIGEVAHAINHQEGITRVQQEIAETIGLLSRLYEAY